MILDIHVYNTFFDVECTQGGFLPNKQLISRFLWTLTESYWDPRIRRFIELYKYCYYDKNTRRLRMPRNYLNDFIAYVEADTSCTYFPPVVGKDINIKMKRKFTDREEQSDLLEYLSDPSTPVKLLEADTGIGKTYCAIKASLVLLGKVTMIQVCGLVNQWKNEVLDKTNIDPKDIYVVQGYASLKKLFRKTKLKPKCFIVSTPTLHQYVVSKRYPYCDLMPYAEFLNKYGIGCRVIDEVHQRFFMNTIIDLNSNVEFTLNLSATYGRSERRSDVIFDHIYPNNLKYGGQYISKHNITFMYSYSLTRYITKVRLVGEKGYMHVKYEQAICKHENTKNAFFNNVLVPLIDSHYINRKRIGDKLLILISTRVMADMLQAFLVKEYPGLLINTYLDKDTDDVLDISDIIISTLGSSGTGRDIKKLITVINTVSFRSEISAKQCIGRLRKLKDMDTVLVDIYNRDLFAHVDHKKTKEYAYKNKSKEFHEYTI